MEFVLKSKNPKESSIDSVKNTTTITQGFYVWVEDFPCTTTGETITVVIESSSSKKQSTIEAEIDTAITDYIDKNYPK